MPLPIAEAHGEDMFSPDLPLLSLNSFGLALSELQIDPRNFNLDASMPGGQYRLRDVRSPLFTNMTEKAKERYAELKTGRAWALREALSDL